MATEAKERKITIYQTVGQNKLAIISSALNWGELQDELATKYNISTNNMKVVIGETQNSLESRQGALMKDNFTLLMMPQKVKSGQTYKIIYKFLARTGE